MKFSIAMCTYNGERFLQEQLDSFVRQTRLPDELVICDDDSSDGTLDVIRAFAASAPFPVKWSKNGSNLGSTRNFQHVIALCEGDIIALSDQDDVWNENKLMMMEELYLSSPDMGGVFSNGNVVGEGLSPLGYTLWDSFRFPERKRRSFSGGSGFEVLLNHNVATGATMSFRSSLRDRLMPIPDEWVHDAWIAIIISLCSDLRLIDRCLIEYRQHDSQQIGGRKTDLADAGRLARSVYGYSAQIRQYELLNEHMLKLMPSPPGHRRKEVLEKIEHLETRTAIYGSGVFSKAGMAACELLKGRYHKYSNGWLSIFKDLFLAGKQLREQGRQTRESS